MEVFKKLQTDYKTERSIGNYKGAAGEILDALSAVLRDAGSLVKLSIPKGNKGFDRQYLDSRSTTNMEDQDIDRTEMRQTATYGHMKFYIEVKADSHTAVEKHICREQLYRMKAVVQSKANNVSKDGIFQRAPAVSIENPLGWLELFTSGVAHIYRVEGFYLIIDGCIFSPGQLMVIDTYVWKEATEGEAALPATYDERTSKRKWQLKQYFTAQNGKFEPPATWFLRVRGC